MYAKWEASSWAKKKARKVKRASMTDFDRFKVRPRGTNKRKVLRFTCDCDGHDILSDMQVPEMYLVA